MEDWHLRAGFAQIRRIEQENYFRNATFNATLRFENIESRDFSASGFVPLQAKSKAKNIVHSQKRFENPYRVLEFDEYLIIGIGRFFKVGLKKRP